MKLDKTWPNSSLSVPSIEVFFPISIVLLEVTVNFVLILFTLNDVVFADGLWVEFPMYPTITLIIPAVSGVYLNLKFPSESDKLYTKLSFTKKLNSVLGNILPNSSYIVPLIYVEDPIFISSTWFITILVFNGITV